MRDCTKFQFGHWRGVVRNGWMDIFSDVDQLATSGKLIVDKADRMVRCIETTRGKVFYKRICGTGSSREWYFMKGLFRPTRSLAIWRVSEKMLLNDLGCPVPLLAASARRFSDFCLEDIFISAEISAPTMRSLLENANNEEEQRNILQKAGQGIRELHDKGFVHGDCLPGNICMDHHGKLFFLDNDRTRQTGLFCAKSSQRWNLVQFCSRTIKLLSAPTWLSYFWRGYYLHDNRPVQVLELEQIFLQKKIQRRLAQLEEEAERKRKE